MNKAYLSIILRKSHLMHFTDKLRYYYFKSKNWKKNREFIKKNSNSILPPDYYIYESFQLNYKEYFTKSKNSAEWVLNFYKKYKHDNPTTVLDWGCGPGRIIRHLPQMLNEDSKIYGTDYNKKSIDWCINNINGIQFNHNTLDALLPYEDNYFDFIFGISIFTHLSKEKHIEWTKELTRVLKKDGIMFFTTHGNAFKHKLTKRELNTFNKGELVLRGDVKEGHRTYTAYHPKKYLEQLFVSNNNIVLDHIEQESTNNKAQQDIWILKKK